MPVDCGNSLSAVGQVLCSSSAGRHPDELVLPGTSENKKIQHRSKNKKITLVVERPKKHLKRASMDNSGGLVQARGKKIIKLERVEDYSPKSSVLPASSSETTCSNSVGQLVGRIICNKAKGHKKQDLDESSSSDSEMGRKQFSLSICGSSERYSRMKIWEAEWSLNQELFERISENWGCPQVDPFAKQENAKTPAFFSLQSQDRALGVDALAHKWNFPLSYAFPHFN